METTRTEGFSNSKVQEGALNKSIPQSDSNIFSLSYHFANTYVSIKSNHSSGLASFKM